MAVIEQPGTNMTLVLSFTVQSKMVVLAPFTEPEVNRFCEWCKNNHLTLNVDKTKEIVFDYRGKNEPLTPLLVDGKIVSIVDSYKYLGLKIDSKLNWSNHAHDVCKKVNKRL